jgi:hypothetical protein
MAGGAIDSFISLMARQNGFARIAQYEVVLHPPQAMVNKINEGFWATNLSEYSRDISLMCDTIAMPGHDLNATTRQFGSEPASHHVTSHAYTGTIASTFYMDANLETKSFFELWQSMAVNNATHKASYYYENGQPTYAGTMEIYQLGSMKETETILEMEGPRNSYVKKKTSTMTHKPIRKYGMKIEGVYPETVGQIEYAYATVDALALLPVEFQYKKWKTMSPIGLNSGYSGYTG